MAVKVKKAVATKKAASKGSAVATKKVAAKKPVASEESSRGKSQVQGCYFKG